MLAACSRQATNPAIHLTESAVEVVGISRETLNTLSAARLTDDQWRTVFRVAISPDAPAMLGSYGIYGGVIAFSPAFPLDRGRPYYATFDPSSVADSASTRDVVTATLTRAPLAPGDATVVTKVYPTADTIPANILRMYVQFSAPMGRKSGIEHIRLLNDFGEDVPGAVLPLDYEFWSPDHRRFTVFFDPGRVKRGILPNREMGRAFTDGQSATLVIEREWRDAQGQPLKEEYRRVFRVGPPVEVPLEPSTWKITAPTAGGRQAMVVTFPWPLDHGLLMRALGVRRDGEVIEGDIEVDAGEIRWQFIPRQPWREGTYQLLALDILEDVAGNQIGRAFEVDNFDTVDKSTDAKSILIPFRVR